MPTLEDVSNFIYSNFNKVSNTKGDTHFHARCVLCGDSKKSKSKKRFHLQFFDEYNVKFKCWNCNESGNFYKLYSLITGSSETDAYKQFNKYNYNKIKKLIKEKSTENINKEKENKYENFNYILNDCISLNDSIDGYIKEKYFNLLKDFIKDRKIDKNVYIAYKGDFQGRIIIPIWKDNQIIYFQGRSVIEGLEPKYLNPSVYKSNIILNENVFNRNTYILATEGLIDADMIGNQGTTFLGKELTIDFINTIRKYTNKGIIIVLDNDKDGLIKLKDYIKQFKKEKTLYFFLMPKKYNHLKDLNDLVKDNYINKDEMYRFVVNNSYDQLRINYELMLKGE